MTRLEVHPGCLMFFVDETGHEEFADPNYPVFGLGGCAILAGAIEEILRTPWRAMKADHFGGADQPLHAADLRNATSAQMDAVGAFFRSQRVGRFAVTMTTKTELPEGYKPYNIMPGALRRRWEELTSRCHPTPVEVALLHEASQRGDELVERYFGETAIHVDGRRIPVHHGLMPKSSDEGLEVADFVIQAAGRHAKALAEGRPGSGKDFQAVFRSNPLWSSFLAVDGVTIQE